MGDVDKDKGREEQTEESEEENEQEEEGPQGEEEEEEGSSDGDDESSESEGQQAQTHAYTQPQYPPHNAPPPRTMMHAKAVPPTQAHVQIPFSQLPPPPAIGSGAHRHHQPYMGMGHTDMVAMQPPAPHLSALGAVHYPHATMPQPPRPQVHPHPAAHPPPQHRPPPPQPTPPPPMPQPPPPPSIGGGEEASRAGTTPTPPTERPISPVAAQPRPPAQPPASAPPKLPPTPTALPTDKPHVPPSQHGLPPGFAPTSFATLAQQAQAAIQGSLPPRGTTPRMNTQPSGRKGQGTATSNLPGFRKITFQSMNTVSYQPPRPRMDGSAATARFTLPSMPFLTGMGATTYASRGPMPPPPQVATEPGMPPIVTQKPSSLPKPPPIPTAAQVAGQALAAANALQQSIGEGGSSPAIDAAKLEAMRRVGQQKRKREDGTEGPAATVEKEAPGKVPEGSNVHWAPEDGRLLCSSSKRLCQQRRMEGYGYCIRHILEDATCPWKQCAYVSTATTKQCTNPVHRNSSNEFCAHHLQVLGVVPRKPKPQKPQTPDPRNAAKRRLSQSDFSRRPERRLGPALTSQERRERRAKLALALRQHRIALPSSSMPLLSDPESSSCDEGESHPVESCVGGDGTNPYTWWPPGYDLANAEEEPEDMDYLRAAGVFTEEELLERRRQKLLQLKDLYMAQYRRLRMHMADHQGLLLCARDRHLKAHNTTLTALPLPFEPAHPDAHTASKHKDHHGKEEAGAKKEGDTKKEMREEGKGELGTKAEEEGERLAEKAEAHRRWIRRYRRRHGTEGQLEEAQKNRSKPSSLCVHVTDGQRCTSIPMALSKFCFRHILHDPRQVLYKACSHRDSTGSQCPVPILAWRKRRHCDMHVQLADFPRLDRPMPGPNTGSKSHKAKEKVAPPAAAPASAPASAHTPAPPTPSPVPAPVLPTAPTPTATPTPTPTSVPPETDVKAVPDPPQAAAPATVPESTPNRPTFIQHGPMIS